MYRNHADHNEIKLKSNYGKKVGKSPLFGD